MDSLDHRIKYPLHLGEDRFGRARVCDARDMVVCEIPWLDGEKLAEQIVAAMNAKQWAHVP